MPEDDKHRMLNALRHGDVRLGMVRIWDSAAPDGDQVRVVGAGYSQIFTLRKEPQVLYVPFSLGGTITITAAKDGGGGNVTLGLDTVIGPFFLPPMVIGQSIEVPVL